MRSASPHNTWPPTRLTILAWICCSTLPLCGRCILLIIMFCGAMPLPIRFGCSIAATPDPPRAAMIYKRSSAVDQLPHTLVRATDRQQVGGAHSGGGGSMRGQQSRVDEKRRGIRKVEGGFGESLGNVVRLGSLSHGAFLCWSVVQPAPARPGKCSRRSSFDDGALVRASCREHRRRPRCEGDFERCVECRVGDGRSGRGCFPEFDRWAARMRRSVDPVAVLAQIRIR